MVWLRLPGKKVWNRKKDRGSLQFCGSPFWKCPQSNGVGDPAVQETDRSGSRSLLHIRISFGILWHDTGGGEPCVAGGNLRKGGRNLCSGYGGTGEDRYAGEFDKAFGISRMWIYRWCILKAAAWGFMREADKEKG